MSGRELKPGVLPKEQRRSRVDRHLLALTGGGYRGLFTTEIIKQIERSGTNFADHFDMIAGTSIGGIIAIGLACNVSGEILAELICRQGPTIFKPQLTSFGGLIGARYGSSGLKQAIIMALGQNIAKQNFCDIPVPLVVCAVDESTSLPRIFRTNLASNGLGDQVKIIDVALATSAAPTYFPPHPINNINYVDGGLIANAPDLVLLTEAIRCFGCNIEDCHLLSIGTAGSPRQGKVKGSPGKLGWIARHELVQLIMTAQEDLAISQVTKLPLANFLRMDNRPSNPVELDDVSEQTTNYLISLAQESVINTKRNQAPKLNMFLSHCALR